MITKEVIKKWMLEDNGAILEDPKNEGVFTGYITITPERAEALLGINTSNRKMGKNNQVPGLVDALKNGYWDENVSKINIACDDTLSDGQNRLYAGIVSQVTFRCLVTYGLKTSAQRVTDRRGCRTLNNDMSIAGFTQSLHNAALTRTMYLTKECKAKIQTLIGHGQTQVSVSDAHLYDYFVEHKETITETQKRVAKIYASVRDLEISQSILNLLVPAFDEVSLEDANCFWNRLSTGVTTKEDDPIITLRVKLAVNAHNKANKIPKVVVAALIIKAWNFYMRGETPKMLKFTSGGANPEPFPEIYNPSVGEK